MRRRTLVRNLGDGDMDWDRIAEALRDIRFRGATIIELAHESDFVPTRLRLSRVFVREPWGSRNPLA